MERKANIIIPKTISVIMFTLVIIVNSLSNILPINGKTAGEISDMYPNLFVPVGFTFSIWGVIYLFLLMYTIYQTGIFTKHSDGELEKVKGIAWFYILTCIANIGWILCWHYGLVLLSVVVMLVLLITLIIIYQKIRTEKASTWKEKLFILSPFSLYLGWITVATIANITAFLVSIRWNGWGISHEIWTSIVILVAIGITLLNQKKFNDVLYSLVIIWSLVGILIKHVTVYNSQYYLVIGVVCVGLAAILFGTLFIFMRNNRVRK